MSDEIIKAEDRAKAVVLLIQDKPSEIQLEIIAGAIRGATEQAARLALRHKTNAKIAKAIRDTMQK